MLDAIIAERVLDIAFRESLERTQGFCRRHVAELVAADRRGPGGILGSSILLRGDPRPAARAAPRRARARGRIAAARGWPAPASGRRASPATRARRRSRPPSGGSSARTGDPAWAAAVGGPFCLDDLLALWRAAGARPSRRSPGASSTRSGAAPRLTASSTTRPRPPTPARPTRGRGRRGGELLGGTRPIRGPA